MLKMKLISSKPFAVVRVDRNEPTQDSAKVIVVAVPEPEAGIVPPTRCAMII